MSRHVHERISPETVSRVLAVEGFKRSISWTDKPSNIPRKSDGYRVRYAADGACVIVEWVRGNALDQGDSITLRTRAETIVAMQAKLLAHSYHVTMEPAPHPRLIVFPDDKEHEY